MHFQYEACPLDAFCLLMQRHTDIEFFFEDLAKLLLFIRYP